MAARWWGRVGWVLFAVAVVGAGVYMGVVGWSQATAIATIGAFVLAAIGLALAVADRRSAALRGRGDVTMRMRHVDVGGSAEQKVDLLPGDRASQDMARVNARAGNARQRARVVNWQRGGRRRGARHG